MFPPPPPPDSGPYSEQSFGAWQIPFKISTINYIFSINYWTQSYHELRHFKQYTSIETTVKSTSH